MSTEVTLTLQTDVWSEIQAIARNSQATAQQVAEELLTTQIEQLHLMAIDADEAEISMPFLQDVY